MMFETELSQRQGGVAPTPHELLTEAHDALVQLVAWYNHTSLVRANQATAKIREALGMPPIFGLVTEIDPVKEAADKKAIARSKQTRGDKS